MSWKNEVQKVINVLCPVGGVFSLDDIYQFGDHFKSFTRIITTLMKKYGRCCNFCGMTELLISSKTTANTGD